MDTPSNVFSGRQVRIAELAYDLAPTILRELVFQKCEILGPAVLHTLGSTQWRSNRFVDGRAQLWVLNEDKPYVGGIGVQDCLFEDCTIRGVAIAGPESLIRRFFQ